MYMLDKGKTVVSILAVTNTYFEFINAKFTSLDECRTSRYVVLTSIVVSQESKQDDLDTCGNSMRNRFSK